MRDRNQWESWQQGKFIDGRRYAHMSERWKNENRAREALLVRPSPEGNAICTCRTPEDAQWIAERLNLAAKYERKFISPLTTKAQAEELPQAEFMGSGKIREPLVTIAPLTNQKEVEEVFRPVPPEARSGIYRVTEVEPSDEQDNQVDVRCQKIGSHLVMAFSTSTEKSRELGPGDLLDVRFQGEGRILLSKIVERAGLTIGFRGELLDHT